MTSQPTDAAFLSEAARLASGPDTEQAIQSILQLTADALSIARLSCRAEQDGFLWKATQSGYSSQADIATDHRYELRVREKRVGELRASAALGDVEASAVIMRLLASVLRDRELDLAEREVQSYRDRMVRLVTHDLRTPLSQILGYAHLLQMDLTDMPEQLRFVEGVIASGGQMDRLLESLLRIERLRHSPRDLYSNVYVYKLAQNAFRDCQYAAEQKGVLLEADLEMNTSAMVYGDEFLIQRAMENLVTNAIKFTLPDGRVTLRLRFTPEEMVFSVDDTGIGIAEEHLDYLFIPFHRISSNNNSQKTPPGYGLGLSLVGSIVEQHQGDVFVHSVLNQGSTFGFRLKLTR